MNGWINGWLDGLHKAVNEMKPAREGTHPAVILGAVGHFYCPIKAS